MPLTDVLERLYARRRFGIRPGVDRVVKLLGRLGNPEKQFRTIHVVGTNGKGSTSAFLSSVLLHAGHQAAQFSSPHLVRFTERFRINGKEYSAEKLAKRLNTVLEAAPEDATFFEITTALAAFIFSEERVEIAVMEAGMGGKSDATAAFQGEMTIITPIALDHTDYLGTTIEEIAREKAGIIKPGTQVISAEQPTAAKLAIENRCRTGNSTLKTFGKDFSAALSGSGTLDYHGMSRSLPQLTPGLSGRYQSMNAAVALAAAEALEAGGMVIKPSAFKKGIAAAYWPGRMELVPGTPRLLLDGAHNPAGVEAMAGSITAIVGGRRTVAVVSILGDKDAAAMVGPLAGVCAAVIATRSSHPRAAAPAVIAHLAKLAGMETQIVDDPLEAVRHAHALVGEAGAILVCGSLYLLADVRDAVMTGVSTGAGMLSDRARRTGNEGVGYH